MILAIGYLAVIVWCFRLLEETSCSIAAIAGNIASPYKILK